MISLDVIAMFPNIPLELVKENVSNRWIKVKSHRNLDEKKFLKGLDFIMNSAKFKFNVTEEYIFWQIVKLHFKSSLPK